MAIANGTCVILCNQPKAHFGVQGTTLIAVNVTWMKTGFNDCQTHSSMYLQPFTSYSEILVGNCNFFLPLANAPVGVFPLEFREKLSSSEN